MERNLALELVRVTEAAALAAARENGRGDEMAPERAAIGAMVTAFQDLEIEGELIVGQGYAAKFGSDHLGNKGTAVDVAINALEGGISCALGGPNAMSVVALTTSGGMLRCPANTYMEKIATTADAVGVLDLDKSPTDNLKALAELRSVYVEDLTVIILDRPRHDSLVDEVRAAGARVKLIPHGDVSAAMAAAREGSGVDLLLGTGGGEQGILSAAAIKCMGGVMQCRFHPRSKSDADALYAAGISDPSKKLELDDMASGDVLFAGTGVTDGEYLRGVRFSKGGAVSHSVVMRSASGTVRLLETRHRFDYKPDYH